jgi:hypothetical protein
VTGCPPPPPRIPLLQRLNLPLCCRLYRAWKPSVCTPSGTFARSHSNSGSRPLCWLWWAGVRVSSPWSWRSSPLWRFSFASFRTSCGRYAVPGSPRNVRNHYLSQRLRSSRFKLERFRRRPAHCCRFARRRHRRPDRAQSRYLRFHGYGILRDQQP